MSKIKIDSFVDGIALINNPAVADWIRQAPTCKLGFYLPASRSSWYLKVPDTEKDPSQKAWKIAEETIPYSQSCVPTHSTADVLQKRFNINICLNGSGWGAFTAPEPQVPNAHIDFYLGYTSGTANNLQAFMNGVNVTASVVENITSGAHANSYHIDIPYESGNELKQGITGDLTLIGVASADYKNLSMAIPHAYTNYTGGGVVPTGQTVTFQVLAENGYYFDVAPTASRGTLTWVNDEIYNYSGTADGDIVISGSTKAYITTQVNYLPVNGKYSFSSQPFTIKSKEGAGNRFLSTVSATGLNKITSITWALSNGDGDTVVPTVEPYPLTIDWSGVLYTYNKDCVSLTITTNVQINAYSIIYVGMPAGTFLSKDDTEVKVGDRFEVKITLPSGKVFYVPGVSESPDAVRLSVNTGSATPLSVDNYRSATVLVPSVDMDIIITFA